MLPDDPIKTILYLHTKIREFPLLKEQLAFLEYEKKDTIRIMDHYKGYKLTFSRFFRNKGRMLDSNCPELEIISLKIQRAIDEYYQINGKLLKILLTFTFPTLFFYKSVFMNYFIYKKFYLFYYNKLDEYLTLIKDEITFCRKQMSLGFEESQILKYHKKIYIDENYVKLKEENNSDMVFVPPEYKISRRKFKTEKIQLDEFDTIQNGKNLSHNHLIFLTQIDIRNEIKNKNTTKQKLIFLYDLLKDLNLLQNSFNEIIKDFVNHKTINECLRDTLLKEPDIFYYLKSIAASDNKNKLKNDSGMVSRYLLIIYLAQSLNDYKKLLAYINKEIAFYEKRLSLESDIVNDIQNDYLKNSNVRVKKTNTVSKIKKNINKIVWLGNDTQLIDLFFNLHEAGLMPDYDDNEILPHFVNDKHKEYEYDKSVKYVKLQWNGTDEDFPELINLLVKEKFITKNRKYSIFCQHFLNKDGKEFQWLSQKNHYGKTYAAPNALITDSVQKLKDIN